MLTMVNEAGVLSLCCGSEWTAEDTENAARLGEKHSGDVLVIDISSLTLVNGFSLLAETLWGNYRCVVIVCGTIENRAKVEVIRRMEVLPCPVIPVLSYNATSYALGA